LTQTAGVYKSNISAYFSFIQKKLVLFQLLRVKEFYADIKFFICKRDSVVDMFF
jgi:hypothetical protein